ncbi:MAG: glutathione synthase [Alphaproteobacteria bacterium]|nr:glutathione synthase [Alphaproteobacteria bacterium]
MSLAVAIQMDPIQHIDIKGDSTFALALEAKARGHGLYFYLPRDLSMNHGRIIARAHRLDVRREEGNHFSLGEQELIDLATFDVVLLRQDPPFDMSYISTTHMLEHVHPQTLVVNDPHHVRNAPEKLFVAHFPELMPPTLISSSKQDILGFRDEHKDIIMKPVYGNGGAGVFRIREDDENFNSLFEMFTEFYREPIVVQRYLPEVRQGDKRVILVDGEAVGAINRVPAKGESRSNMHVGGRAEKAELTDRDREICHAIGPALKERGLIFVGIDIIGPYLTEINVTSPTGIQEIDRFDGINIAGMIWDVVEGKINRAVE